MPSSAWKKNVCRSEEHTSELQSLTNLVCRLLLEKKTNTRCNTSSYGKSIFHYFKTACTCHNSLTLARFSRKQLLFFLFNFFLFFFFFLLIGPPRSSSLFPSSTLFR